MNIAELSNREYWDAQATVLHLVLGVRRQLFFPVNDNYFSRSTTIRSFVKAISSSTLMLTGAEGKALRGRNLSG